MNSLVLPKHQSGFSMIEVLVTIVVVSLGLLGFAGLQAHSLKSSTIALHRSYATMLAYDIVDCMRANRAAAIGSNYNLGFATPAVGGTVAGDDMVAWKTALTNSLPGGQGQVTVNAQGSVQVDIRWGESINSDRTLTFTTQTSL